jgi:methionine-rich copper-binding protein CopC
MPAHEAVLEAAPKEVVLHFSDPVRLTLLSIQAQDGPRSDVRPCRRMRARISCSPRPLSARAGTSLLGARWQRTGT